MVRNALLILVTDLLVGDSKIQGTAPHLPLTPELTPPVEPGGENPGGAVDWETPEDASFKGKPRPGQPLSGCADAQPALPVRPVRTESAGRAELVVEVEDHGIEARGEVDLVTLVIKGEPELVLVPNSIPVQLDFGIHAGSSRIERGLADEILGQHRASVRPDELPADGEDVLLPMNGDSEIGDADTVDPEFTEGRPLGTRGPRLSAPGGLQKAIDLAIEEGTTEFNPEVIRLLPRFGGLVERSGLLSEAELRHRLGRDCVKGEESRETKYHRRPPDPIKNQAMEQIVVERRPF